MIKLVLIGLVILATVHGTAKAQDSLLINLPVTWHLEDCISYATKNNLSLATLRLTARSYNEDLLQSKAGVLPNLTGTVSQSLINSKNSSAIINGYQTQANFSSNYGVNSSMTLYNGGYLKNDIRSKEFWLQSANLSIKETENSLTLSITQAFFNIMLAREIMTALENVLATSQGQLQQGQQQFDAGSIAKKDFLLLQSQVATDQYNLVNAGNNFNLNTVDLKQLLLLPPTYRLQLNAPDSFLIQQTATSLGDALQQSQQTRPEIKNKELQVQISEIELQKIKASTKPTISLGAGLATGYSANQAPKYLPQLQNNFYQSLNVNMGIPIYSRRVNKTNINKTDILLQQSTIALSETKNLLNQQVERTYINLQNSMAQYTAAEIQLRTSEEVYRITNEQLKLGALNTVELLLQKNAYVQALQSFAQAKYTTVLYNKIYQFYIGIPVTF
jgi:outer membrane protein